MTYIYQPDHEAMATALRRVLSEPDDALASFIEEMMPPDVVLRPEQLRVLRDLLGKLCEAPLTDDRSLWEALEACHRRIFPPEKEPLAPAGAGAPEPPARGGPSPWMKGAATSSAPVAPPSPMPQPPAPPPVGASLEPDEAMSRTAPTPGRRAEPALPFAGKSPAPSSTSLEPHPEMGATIARESPSGAAVQGDSVVVDEVTVTLDAYARATAALMRGEPVVSVVAICGLTHEGGWGAVELAFSQRFSADPEAQARYRELIVRYRR